MAINFNDPTCGFYHQEVVAFVNEQIVKGGPSRFFDRIHLCKSWNAVERELLTIVTDSAIPRSLKKSCAWSALALGRSLAKKRCQEYREKVKIMQDQLEEQRLFINALLGMVQKQRDKNQGEKAVEEFRLQQGLTDLNRAQGEQSVLTTMPFSLVRTQFQSQEGRKDEAQGTRSYPLGSVVPLGDGGYDWTVREPLRLPGQSASTAAPPVPFDEETRFSVRTNRNENSSSEIQGTWSQTLPLASLNLSSSSVQPLLVSQVAAAEVEQVSTVPALSCSRASWRGNQFHRRKLLPHKFRPRADPSEYSKYPVIQRPGDWYCDACNVINFSWRNVCFRCKQFQEKKVIGGILHNWTYL
jgi:hypothetical protein